MKANDLGVEAIRSAIRHATDSIVAEEIDAAKKRVEQRVRERVAQMAIAMAKEASIEYGREIVTIRVKFDGQI